MSAASQASQSPLPDPSLRKQAPGPAPAGFAAISAAAFAVFCRSPGQVCRERAAPAAHLPPPAAWELGRAGPAAAAHRPGSAASKKRKL